MRNTKIYYHHEVVIDSNYVFLPYRRTDLVLHFTLLRVYRFHTLSAYFYAEQTISCGKRKPPLFFELTRALLYSLPLKKTLKRLFYRVFDSRYTSLFNIFITAPANTFIDSRNTHIILFSQWKHPKLFIVAFVNSSYFFYLCLR